MLHKYIEMYLDGIWKIDLQGGIWDSRVSYKIYNNKNMPFLVYSH